MLDIVFIKETYQFSRRFTSYLIRFLYILVIFIFIALIYSGQLGNEMSSSALETKLEAFGRKLYYLIAWIQIVLTVILTPVVVSNAFVSETRENTLQLIQLTGLTDRSIVLGKVLGKFLSLFLIILTGLPVLFFAKLFGFIDFQLIIGNFVNSLSLMLITGGIAAFYGLTNSKLTTALFKTLSTLFIMQLIVLFAGFFTQAFDIEPGNFNYSVSIGMSISPIYNQIMLVITRGEEGIPQFMFYIIVFAELWLSFVVFWYFILKAERQYRWWSLGLIAFSGTALKSSNSDSTSSNNKVGYVRREPIAKVNPVEEADVKTFDRKKFQTVTKIIFPTLTSVIVVVWLTTTSDKYGIESIEQFIGGCKTILTVLVAFTGIWVSFSLASEKENRTLDVLLSTPISNMRIMKIALKDFWDCVKFALIAVGFGLFIGALTTDLSVIQVLSIWIVFLLIAVFFVVTSLYFSATSETSVKAIIKATIFATAVLILPIILSELFFLVDMETVGAILGVVSPYQLFDAIAVRNNETVVLLNNLVGYSSGIVALVAITYLGIAVYLTHKMTTNLRYVLQDDD